MTELTQDRPPFYDHASRLSRSMLLRPFQIVALVFLCLASSAVFADPAPLISPLATARPVIARHGMVVTQEAAASRVGLDILERGRQRRRCGGRGRLRARRHAAARRQPRRGRLHADPSRRPRPDDRHRLSRIRARRDDQGRVSRRQRRGRSVQVALFRPGDRRAGNRRRPRARLAQIWLGQILLRGSDRAGDRARAPGPHCRRRCRRFAAAGGKGASPAIHRRRASFSAPTGA